jgi:hypothetical protein
VIVTTGESALPSPDSILAIILLADFSIAPWIQGSLVTAATISAAAASDLTGPKTNALVLPLVEMTHRRWSRIG